MKRREFYDIELRPRKLKLRTSVRLYDTAAANDECGCLNCDSDVWVVEEHEAKMGSPRLRLVSDSGKGVGWISNRGVQHATGATSKVMENRIQVDASVGTLLNDEPPVPVVAVSLGHKRRLAEAQSWSVLLRGTTLVALDDMNYACMRELFDKCGISRNYPSRQWYLDEILDHVGRKLVQIEASFSTDRIVVVGRLLSGEEHLSIGFPKDATVEDLLPHLLGLRCILLDGRSVGDLAKETLISSIMPPNSEMVGVRGEAFEALQLAKKGCARICC